MKKTNRLLLIYIALLLSCVMAMVSIREVKTSRQEVPRDFPEIQREGVLRMVTEYSASGYFVEVDTIRGFQYELSQSISKLSGLEVQTSLEMSIAESFSQLDRQTCDVIARNIPVTIELKEKYLFTDPIILDKQVLVQRTAEANDGIEPLRNQLDLAGKTIYVPKDSPALFRIRNMIDEMADTIYICEDELYSDEQLIIMVAHGDIDFAVCDQHVALDAASRFQEIDAGTDISFTQIQSWAVRKDSPILLDSLNSWLKSLRESGEFNEIYKRYFLSE